MRAPSTLSVDRVNLSAERGWRRIARRSIAARYYPGTRAWRMFFAAPAQVHVKSHQIDQSVLMPARGILTIRPETTSLVPFAFNGDFSDYNSGNANGVSPCGDPESVLVHDRIMQRCPVGRYDLNTGNQIKLPAPGYHLSGGAHLDPYPDPSWPFIEYDGEHRIRAYRVGLAHLGDEAVRDDMLALLEDSRLFWKPYGNAILSGPAHKGHGYVGRSWAWTTFLALVLGDPFAEFMLSIFDHVVEPTGACQRLKKGEFNGSPSPWGPWRNAAGQDVGGSDVPDHVQVFQRFEMHHVVTVLVAAGRFDQARKLGQLTLRTLSSKWCDADTGQPTGSRYGDPEQAMFGCGSIARFDKPLAAEMLTGLPIPRHKNFGGSVGPFAKTADSVAALREWDTPGKSRWLLEAFG